MFLFLVSILVSLFALVIEGYDWVKHKNSVRSKGFWESEDYDCNPPTSTPCVCNHPGGGKDDISDLIIVLNMMVNLGLRWRNLQRLSPLTSRVRFSLRTLGIYVSQPSTESSGFTPGTPVSSHRECWQGGLGLAPNWPFQLCSVIRHES
jgi:hypothetical protein